MKVYVVKGYVLHDEFVIMGVFSSEIRAEEYAKELEEDASLNEWFDIDVYEVQE